LNDAGHVAALPIRLALETVVAIPVVSAVVGALVWFLQSRIEAARAERRRLQDERRKIYIPAYSRAVWKRGDVRR